VFLEETQTNPLGLLRCLCTGKQSVKEQLTERDDLSLLNNPDQTSFWGFFIVDNLTI
jgi:hypothetical protein